MILVDTNIIIDFLEGNQKATEFFKSLNLSDVLLSVITEAELLSGKQCKEERVREEIQHLLSRFLIINVDERIAQTAADYRRNYGVPLLDSLIAATAHHNQATVFTRNTKDFRKIKEVKTITPY